MTQYTLRALDELKPIILNHQTPAEPQPVQNLILCNSLAHLLPSEILLCLVYLWYSFFYFKIVFTSLLLHRHVETKKGLSWDSVSEMPCSLSFPALG